MRVVLLDDSFSGTVGHNAGYNFSICDELSKRSIEFLIFANRNLRKEKIDYPNLHYGFRHFALMVGFDRRVLPFGLSGFVNLLRANFGHLYDLLTNIDGEIRGDDLLVACYQSPFSSFAYAIWLAWLALRGKHPKLVLVLHNEDLRFWRYEAAFFRFLRLNKQVSVVAHTEIVAKMCTQIGNVPCNVLPLPFVKAIQAKLSDIPDEHIVTFVFPGSARYIKGFDLVVNSIAELRDCFLEKRIRYRIQCNSKPENDEALNLIKKLNKYAQELPGIEIITAALDVHEYSSLLESADIVLIPNRSEWYRSALSGVLAEALAIGKPTILANGAYMSTDLEKKGSTILFENGNAHALADAIRRAIPLKDTLRKVALKTKDEWLDFHNPARYVDLLLDLAQ